MSSEEYVSLVKQNYDLIISEFDHYLSLRKPDALAQVYPKLVILYQYFRLLRGEGFSLRPGVGEEQQNFYAMENEIKMKLKIVKEQLNPNDQRTKYYIDEMCKFFALE